MNDLIYEFTRRDGLRTYAICPTLQAAMGTGGNNVPCVLNDDPHMSQRVRRLTPLECERLQGFPTITVLDFENMTPDQALLVAIATKSISVEPETGIIKLHKDKDGNELLFAREVEYYATSAVPTFCVNGKAIARARAVWVSVNGEVPKGMYVKRIDTNAGYGIKNLILLPKEGRDETQALYAGRKFGYEIKAQIMNDFESGELVDNLIKKYGVSRRTIGRIIKSEGWTQIPYRGKPSDKCPDSPRYKAIGNSWTVPVVRWIGERISKFFK